MEISKERERITLKQNHVKWSEEGGGKKAEFCS